MQRESKWYTRKKSNTKECSIVELKNKKDMTHQKQIPQWQK